jgi:hypothetical protein
LDNAVSFVYNAVSFVYFVYFVCGVCFLLLLLLLFVASSLEAVVEEHVMKGGFDMKMKPTECGWKI